MADSVPDLIPEGWKVDWMRYAVWGSMLNVVPIYVFYPLRTVRVLQQSDLGSNVLARSSILQVIKDRYRAGGISTLFKGAVSFSAGSVFVRLVQFGSYDSMKEWATEHRHVYPIFQNNTMMSFAIGIASASLTTSLMLPFDVLSQNLTVATVRNKINLSTIIPTQPSHHSGSPTYNFGREMHTASTRILSPSLNFRYLFRGYGATMSSSLAFFALYFPVFEITKQKLLNTFQRHEAYSFFLFSELVSIQPMNPAHKLGYGDNLAIIFTSGMLASLSACFVAAPLDLVKTRIQTAEANATSNGLVFETKWAQVFRKVLQDEGWRGFYRGMNARLWTTIPFGAFNFVIFDYVKRLSLIPVNAKEL